MKRGENTAGDDIGRTFEIRVNGRRLVRTNQLTEAQWAARAAAQAGKGAEIVDAETGRLIERYPPPQ
jgi:hypothetical protein